MGSGASHVKKTTWYELNSLEGVFAHFTKGEIQEGEKPHVGSAAPDTRAYIAPHYRHGRLQNKQGGTENEVSLSNTSNTRPIPL